MENQLIRNTMNCPTCTTELKMSERSGIEIDYCPQCRGVWLDRGELDKIIERSQTESKPQQKLYNDDNNRYNEKEKYYDRSKHHDDDKNYGHRKKKSFLGDLFDF